MSVEDILRQMGENARRGQAQRGSLVGDAISAVSQIPGQIMDERSRAAIMQQQRDRLAAQDARQAKGDARDEAAYQGEQQQQAIAHQLLTVYTAGTPNDPHTNDLDGAIAEAKRIGAVEWIPKLKKMHADELAAAQPKLTSGAPGSVMRGPDGKVIAGSEIPVNKPDYTIGDQRFAGDGTAIGVAVPAKVKPPELGSFGDYVTRYAAEKGIEPSMLKPVDVEAARKAYQQSDDRPRININTGNPSDVKESVAGMKDGTLPPQIPGKASKDYTAVMAEAHRQGYDLARAATDWTATQKHVATMNGAQQLRLNQAINALPDMLDNVDQLASKWKGGKFPILNKANLALAKGGAYGSEVASIANQLDAQIADVTADLGNVYMGGNSPTDHALGLAGKSLNGTWDEKVLHDMVKLAKQNVVIRRNSIANTGVAGASATNPYSTQAPAAAPAVKLTAEELIKKYGG